MQTGCASENDDDNENVTYKRQGTKMEEHWSYQWSKEVKQSQIRIKSSVLHNKF